MTRISVYFSGPVFAHSNQRKCVLRSAPLRRESGHVADDRLSVTNGGFRSHQEIAIISVEACRLFSSMQISYRN